MAESMGEWKARKMDAVDVVTVLSQAEGALYRILGTLRGSGDADALADVLLALAKYQSGR